MDFNWTRGESSFAERMQNVDPDLRQMALYDLGTALGRSEFIIGESEQQITLKWILKCFSETEKNSEVVNNAVRIVGPAAIKFSPRNQETLIASLSRLVSDTPPPKLSPSEATALRENAAMSLKLAVQSFAKLSSTTPELFRVTIPVITNSAKILARSFSGGKVESRITAEILDVLSEFAEIYGADFSSAHSEVFPVCLNFLTTETVVRKRSTKCLARLAPYLAAELFDVVTSTLTTGLHGTKATNVYVEVCNAVCRTSAKRFVDQGSVDQIVASFLSELNRLQHLPEDLRDSREADETREQILSALESFVAHCQSHISGRLDSIIDAVQSHVQWDPNYCVMDDEEMEGFEDDETVDFDDGDTSWKVRIAASRCLTAIVQAFSSRTDVVVKVLQITLGRLGERVEQVRLTVLDVLLKIVEVSAKHLPLSKSSESVFIPASSTSVARTPLGAHLVANREKIVEKLVQSAGHKDLKVKLGSIVTLREFFSSFGCDSSIKPLIFAAVHAIKADPRHQLPALHPESLALLQRLVVATFRINSQEEAYHELLDVLLQHVFPIVLTSLDDRFFKTSLTALRVAQQLIFLAAARPSISRDLFSAVQRRLMAADADIEMKRCALETIALMVVHLHAALDVHQELLQTLFPYLSQLLSSETVRIAVCKCIDVLAQAPNLPVAPLSSVTGELVALLRKSDRQVRESALLALNRVAQNYSASFSQQSLDAAIAALGETSCIDDKDLFITSQALALATSLTVTHANAAKRLAPLVSTAIGLMCSNHVQGIALEKCIQFLSTFAVTMPDATDDIFKKLCDAASRSPSLIAVAVLSSATGSIVGALAQSRGQAAAIGKLQMLSEHPSKGFVFAAIGSCGQHVPLPDALKSMLVKGSTDGEGNEDVCAAAALGLGRAAAVATNSVLLNDIARILSSASATSAHRQHALRSLKEAIGAAAQEKSKSSPLFEPATAKCLLGVLLQQVSSTPAEDFLMDIIIESTGRLTSLCIEGCAPDLAVAAASPNSTVVAIAIGAMKFVTPHTTAEEREVARIIPALLSQLQRSASPVVRRGCVQLFHATLLYRPHLLGEMAPPVLQSILKNIFEELVVDKSLVNEVDLGPFKHRVDHGLELRKVAHECVQSLLDDLLRNRSSGSNMEQAILADGFLSYLAQQLATSSGAPEELETEVCNSSRSALVKIAQLEPSSLAGIGPTLGKKTVTMLNAKTRDGMDQEKINDSIRIAIMCLIVACRECPVLKTDPSVAEAYKTAQASDKFSAASALAEASR